MTIPDPLGADDSETQAATVDFSVTEDTLTRSIAPAAASGHENSSEAETRFGSSRTAASGDTLMIKHLKPDKDVAKQYSEFNILSVL